MPNYSIQIILKKQKKTKLYKPIIYANLTYFVKN